MDKKLNLSENLSFDEIDLTAPNIVVKKILSELPKETNNYILGDIQEYEGYIESYTKHDIKAIMSFNMDTEVDIQDKLGENENEFHRFECYLYTSEYEKYRYRVFFMEYNIANYPVKIVLEESVARSVFVGKNGYIINCNSREELEQLVYTILNSKRMTEVMQHLIRINQAKKIENVAKLASENND